MKRFFSLILAALMLFSLTASAEIASFDAQGFALDVDEIIAMSVNEPVLVNYGVIRHDPFLSLILVGYYALPKDAVKDIENRMENTGDKEEYQRLYATLSRFSGAIAYILVTDAKTPADAGIDDPIPEGSELTEFGAAGDYHYYFLTEPLDGLLAAFDTDADLSEYGGAPQEMKEKALADIRMVQSEFLTRLQAAALYQPVDPDSGMIGQVIRFESADLDGNPVSSADLFRENKITMVNLWGTWCINCMNEMGELAEIHKRLQEKGCGIVGVEWEQEPFEEVAGLARQTLADYGITYPNAIMPEDDPILNGVQSFPTTFFVDSEGKILTWPIKGAAVDQYESTIDKLLAGDAADAAPETYATANESGEYRVIVYDTDGSPVKGAVVQLCDDTTCSLQKTKADGIASFAVEEQKVYEVHVMKVPEGYVSSGETYRTLDTWSDVRIIISKAE